MKLRSGTNTETDAFAATHIAILSNPEVDECYLYTQLDDLCRQQRFATHLLKQEDLAMSCVRLSIIALYGLVLLRLTSSITKKRVSVCKSIYNLCKEHLPSNTCPPQILQDMVIVLDRYIDQYMNMCRNNY